MRSYKVDSKNIRLVVSVFHSSLGLISDGFLMESLFTRNQCKCWCSVQISNHWKTITLLGLWKKNKRKKDREREKERKWKRVVCSTCASVAAVKSRRFNWRMEKTLFWITSNTKVPFKVFSTSFSRFR